MARSIGDSDSAPYVSHEATTNELILGDDDEFIVLGCDGIFDVLSDQEIVDVLKSQPPELASIVLRDYAFLLGSSDNISVLVMHLN